mgnify:CR=1 FL=1
MVAVLEAGSCRVPGFGGLVKVPEFAQGLHEGEMETPVFGRRGLSRVREAGAPDRNGLVVPSLPGEGPDGRPAGPEAVAAGQTPMRVCGLAGRLALPVWTLGSAW